MISVVNGSVQSQSLPLQKPETFWEGGKERGREANLSQTVFPLCSGSSEPPPWNHGYALAWEGDVWLSAHRCLSYNLSLSMVVLMGSVYISISPAPSLPAPLPGIPHTTVPRAGVCRLGTRFCHSHWHSLLLLPVTPDMVFPFLSVFVRPSLPSGCGYWWEETTWTTWRSSPSLCFQPGCPQLITWLSG